MTRTVTLIPGDGIGPEITTAACRVVDASGVAIEWEAVEAGEVPAQRTGTPVPDEVYASIRRNGVALKGPLTNPVGGGYSSPTATIRRALGLWVNVRRARTFEGVPSPFSGVDIAIVRDTTEGLHNGVEQRVGPDAAVAIKHVTRSTSERIARFAFEYALRSKRSRVTLVHIATVQKLTDGLMLEATAQVASNFSNVTFEDMLIDRACMELVRSPQAFDVLLAGHMHGGMLGDLCAGLVGGPGLLAGGIYGEGLAVFEAGHGSAPRRAGENRVNPTAMLLSAAMLLDHLDQNAAAERIRRGIAHVIKKAEHVTYDLGGGASTSGMADAVIRAMEELPD